MANYIELTKPWQIVEAIEGQTGTRVFVDKTGGPASLPALGDAIDGAYPTCLCRKRTLTLWGGKPGIYQYVCDYSTETTDNSEIDETTAFADLPRTLSVSGEMKRLDSGRHFYWYGTSDIAGVPIYKRIITATLTIPKVYTTSAAIITAAQSYLGKVNDATANFEGLTTEYWLFSGIRSTEYINAAGSKRWRAELSFELRVVPAVGGGTGGWNHVFDPTVPGWKKLTVDPYQTANFTATGLFA